MPRKLLMLMIFAITFFAAASFYLAKSPQGEIPAQGELVLPNLKANINNIEQIHIDQTNHHLTLIHQDDGWHLSEKANYPVDTHKVRNFIFALTEMSIIEPKTKHAPYYERLHLSDLTHESSKATKITLLGKNNQPIEKLLIGKQGPHSNPQQMQWYIRHPHEAQSWLAQSPLPPFQQSYDWLSPQMLSFSLEETNEVTIFNQKQPKPIVLRKLSNEPNFSLISPKPRAEKNKEKAQNNSAPDLARQFAINRLAETVVYFNWKDIIHIKDLPCTTRSKPLAKVIKQDGTAYDVDSCQQEGHTYAWVKAKPRAAADKDTQSEAGNAGNKLSQLNSKYEPWAFLLNADQLHELKEFEEELFVIKKSG